MSALTYYVSFDADDAYEHDDSTGFSVSNAAIVSHTSAASRFNAGYRFQSVRVPRGATIQSAVLSVYIASGAKAAGLDASFYGENVDDSADFNATAHVTSRAKTTAVTTIVDGNPPLDAFYDVDVTAQVQEIVNRTGWVFGQAMMMLGFAGSGTTYTANIIDYSANSLRGARLAITYAGDPVLTLQCTTGNSDAHESATPANFSATATEVICTASGTIGSRYSGGFRFWDSTFGVPILRGSEITQAILQVYVTNLTNNDAFVTIAAHDAVLPGDFAAVPHVQNVSGVRPRTATTVSWTNNGLKVGWNNSPDIKTIIQYLVNRGGWTGNKNSAIVIFLDGGTVAHTFQVHGSENTSPTASGVKLVIGYNPPRLPKPCPSRWAVTRASRY